MYIYITIIFLCILALAIYIIKTDSKNYTIRIVIDLDDNNAFHNLAVLFKIHNIKHQSYSDNGKNAVIEITLRNKKNFQDFCANLEKIKTIEYAEVQKQK